MLSLISEAIRPAVVIEGFHHRQSANFACHDTPKAGKPFEAGFELYGGEGLTLLEIVRSHLPSAGFAFLSTHHTAGTSEGRTLDKALHLAIVVQCCGFWSVVERMWAMVDEDGRDPAEQFYKALFSTSRREQWMPYYEMSAKALQVAVKCIDGSSLSTHKGPTIIGVASYGSPARCCSMMRGSDWMRVKLIKDDRGMCPRATGLSTSWSIAHHKADMFYATE
ncbi:hypothetical protein H4582DRAFT_2064105 [Lactarius indigo]|nr:hypothetical protein H4582DRAFT_2064105 [Lactarius indigo]